MKRAAVKEVIYGFIRGLDGKIPYCKCRMHASCFNETQKTWFMLVGAGIMMGEIDCTGSKAVAITALEICVLTQMVHGGSWKILPSKRHWYVRKSPIGKYYCVPDLNQIELSHMTIFLWVF